MRTPLGLALAILLAPAAAGLPTPGVHCDLGEQLTGRVFPEPLETNDFISYAEALCGLERLDAARPDSIEIVDVAESVGWKNTVTGSHDRFRVFAVEVTDETSDVAKEAKKKLVFQLSIHGNEKGGREGGLRVIEDLARGLGIAEERPELVEDLRDTMLVFVFPNPDGWIHEELAYRAACSGYYQSVTLPTGCLDSQNYVRYNGAGVDLNRDSPTRGWYDERYTAMSEPENIGLVNYLLQYENVVLASDLHGMLQPANSDLYGDGYLCALPDNQGVVKDPQGVAPEPPAHVAPPERGSFVLTMLPAGRQAPDEMATTTTLAELVKERLNSDPHFAEWQAMPKPMGVWGGDFDDWGTVWDTLSYTDSGFTSDWYAQDHGLDAPGVDFEFSYNHICFDSYYPGLGQRMNDYHVHATRVIVATFMDVAREPVAVRFDAHGIDVAVLENPVVVTNTDETDPARGLTGWALDNAADDLYDLAHVDFAVGPHDYWGDLAPYVENGKLDTVRPTDLAASLTDYDVLVVAGSAWDTLDATSLATVRSFAEAGGRVVLTDDALQALATWGLADAVANEEKYAAYADFPDREHALLADVRGLARQLVEPVPLGYEIGRGGGAQSGTIPVWYAEGDALDAAGYLGDGQVVVGRTPLGRGEVVFVGAFLPDPTEAYYHPYGLDAYASTYTANQLVLNAIGWSREVEAAPAPSGAPPAPDAAVPSIGVVAAVAAFGLVAVLARRRR